MTDIVKILEGELDRIAKALPTLDPKTREYATVVENLGEVYYRICNFKVPNVLTVHKDNAFEFKVDCTTDSAVRTPVAEPTPAPVAEPTPAPVVDNTDWNAYRTSLRERLADGRIKGVNVATLLGNLGVSKFSSVPDNQLTELSDMLDEALKELT